MSNKTRLQTNNTNLQTLINKANSLPNAGGSSGGSIETCTVVIDIMAPIQGVEAYYIGDGMTLQSTDISMMGATINVVKNTMLLLIGWSSMSECSENVEQICPEIYFNGNMIYFIKDDCTLTYK